MSGYPGRMRTFIGFASFALCVAACSKSAPAPSSDAADDSVVVKESTTTAASAALSPSLAEDEGINPIGEWIVLDTPGAIVEVRKVGETPLGTIEGWSCVASLITGVESKVRKDVLTITCKKGGLEVRGQATRFADDPHRTESMLLLSNSNTSMRTIAFGTRPKKK